MKSEVATPSVSADDAESGDLRARILDAAFGAFLELGYAGTSTLEIATRAKVSKRDLYAHFGSKQALFNAGITERTARMRMAMELPAVATRADLVEALTAYGRTILTEVTHPHILAIHRLAIAEGRRSPELAKILDLEGRGRNVETLQRLVEHAQGLGLLGAVDSGQIAGTFGSLIWRDSFVRLLLGVIPPPTPQEIDQRVRGAVEALIALYGS